MKYYFYLDETGDHGLNFVDPNFPIFLLVGFLISEQELVLLDQKINNFKIDFFKTTEIILHSRDIRKCEGVFQILFDLELKKKFYEDLNNIFSQSDYKLIGAGINKEDFIKKYGKAAKDPYNISLSFIVERLIFCLDNNQNSVEIIIEKRGKKEDQQLQNHYNSISDRGTYYVKPERLKAKITSFKFCHKKENIIGLQAADLCAYPLARHILNSEEPYIPFKLIEKKIYCSHDGKLDGYGLKMFP